MQSRTLVRPGSSSLREPVALGSASSSEWVLAHLPELALGAQLVVLWLDRWRMLADPSIGVSGDAANWLSLSKQLTGAHVKFDDSPYLPGVLVLILVTRLFAEPMIALHITGMIAATASIVGLFVAMRLAGLRWLAVAFSVAFDCAGYSGEAFGWGGYPQLLATGFFLAGLGALVRYLQDGNRAFGIGAVVAMLATAATHHLVTSACVTVVAAGGVWSLLRPDHASRLIRLRRWANVAVASVILSLPVAPVYLSFMRGGYTDVFNAQNFTWLAAADTFTYVFREATTFWWIVAAVACLAPFVTWRLRDTPIWLLTTLLLIGVALAFVGTHEVRYLHLLIAADLLGVALALVWLGRILPVRHVPLVLLVVALSGAEAYVWSTGHPRTIEALRYYGTADNPVMAGINWIHDDTSPEQIVAVAPLHVGIPGWPIEGFGERPTLSSVDPKWLNRTEGQAARTANTLFGLADPDEVARYAREHSVAYIFVDRREWPGYTAWRHSAALPEVYANDAVSIFQVPQR